MATKKSYGGVSVPVITEDDDTFDESVGHRGLPDVTSPVMNPLIEDMLEKGTETIQLVPGDPFSVSQLRYWQPRGQALLPEGKHLKIAGGVNGKNISVSIEDAEGSVTVTETKATEKKAPVKKVAVKKTSPKKAAPVKKAAAKKRPAVKKTASK